MTAFPVSLPKLIFLASAFLLSRIDDASIASMDLILSPSNFLSLKLKTSGCPTVIANPANCIKKSLAIKSESYGSKVTLKDEKSIEKKSIEMHSKSYVFFCKKSTSSMTVHTTCSAPEPSKRNGLTSMSFNDDCSGS